MLRKKPSVAPMDDPLSDFDGHVADRSKLDAEVRVVDEAEFLTSLEPRTAAWQERARRRSGEPTEQGIRMKRLDRRREEQAERAAGVRRRP